MRRTINKTSKFLNLSPQQMKELGFKYDFQLQDYIYEFPVYKYKNIPSIICKLGIDEDTHKIWLNVYDANGGLYTSYYDREYGKSNIVSIIDKNIEKEIKKLQKVGGENKGTSTRQR